jgi:hypothetical protein
MTEAGEPIDDADWVAAAEALRLVSQIMNEYLAQHAIANRARDGLIRTRAVRFMKHRETLDDVELPADFWWAGANAALKQNWATGDFSTWIDRRYEWKAYGVRFSRSDIEAMIPRRDRMPLGRLEAGNYAPAATCVSELRATLACDDATAQRLILKSCRAGLVPSRCSKIRWRVKDRYGENEEQDTNVAVPQWFWEECLEDEATVLNWRTGRFAGTGIVDGDEYKVIVSGVEFEVAAIVEIEAMEAEARVVEEADSGPAASEGGGVPRGPKLSQRWRPWVAELVAHVHENGAPEGVGSQGQEELIKAVADALAARGEEMLARSTVQPIVQAVLDRLRSADN